MDAPCQLRNLPALKYLETSGLKAINKQEEPKELSS